MKAIDAPLATTYTVAVLTADHADRLFLMLDPYRNRLVWSKLYRPAVTYPTIEHAREILQEIEQGEHPSLVDEAAGIDAKTITTLEAQVTFKS